jgi:aryl-phospho-beta-D-glucosidase BglC (GH1 family)
LWQFDNFQKQAFSFWKQLASEVKDHPSIIAYNLLNEPHKERFFGYEMLDTAFEGWLKKIANTSAYLNQFNKKLVQSIREVDPYIPIILDGYFY